MIELEKLAEIKKNLPRGSFKLIQKMAGVSYPTVSMYFRGKSKNVKITEAVISIYKEHLKKVSELNSLKVETA